MARAAGTQSRIVELVSGTALAHPGREAVPAILNVVLSLASCAVPRRPTNIAGSDRARLDRIIRLASHQVTHLSPCVIQIVIASSTPIVSISSARLCEMYPAIAGARANPRWPVLGQPDTFEGWEDSAVPPARLGDYFRDLLALYDEFGFSSDTMPSLYGHFGQGCVHTRIPFDLYSAEGVAAYRAFLERAADLVVAYSGSLSGEHGDGQSRGDLLTKMFGPELVRGLATGLPPLTCCGRPAQSTPDNPRAHAQRGATRSFHGSDPQVKPAADV